MATLPQKLTDVVYVISRDGKTPSALNYHKYAPGAFKSSVISELSYHQPWVRILETREGSYQEKDL